MHNSHLVFSANMVISDSFTLKSKILFIVRGRCGLSAKLLEIIVQSLYGASSVSSQQATLIYFVIALLG